MKTNAEVFLHISNLKFEGQISYKNPDYWYDRLSSFNTPLLAAKPAPMESNREEVNRSLRIYPSGVAWTNLNRCSKAKDCKISNTDNFLNFKNCVLHKLVISLFLKSSRSFPQRIFPIVCNSTALIFNLAIRLWFLLQIKNWYLLKLFAKKKYIFHLQNAM